MKQNNRAKPVSLSLSTECEFCEKCSVAGYKGRLRSYTDGSVRNAGSGEHDKRCALPKGRCRSYLRSYVSGLNTTSEGICACLRTSYFKVSVANFVHQDGRAATGVMVAYETD